MNRNHQKLFSGLLLVLVGYVCHAQEKSKTFKETYNVNNDTELSINTSYADIEFETWTKDQVEITAVIELEGVDDEEAKSYFDKDLVKIMGNSREIEVSTEGSGPFTYGYSSYTVDVPEIPSVAEIIANVDIPEIVIPEIAVIPFMPNMPPMPPMPPIDFDYDAYKKDGDKYMKKWQEEFSKTFDKEYKKRFEEWGKEMEEMAAEREEQREQMKEEREKLREEREKVREEMHERLREQREEVRAQQAEIRQMQREAARTIQGSSNVYYFSSDGKHKEYKVKKRIIIKMPKYIKVNMNVKHGEVKLAENARNINASLSYASLLASTIDGKNTDIRASYSPVIVQQWNYGNLSTDYSDDVNLKTVKDLNLKSVSSNVVIGEVASKALVRSSFGSVNINSVATGFTNLDISMENGELDCKLPKTPFVISVDESSAGSVLHYPKSLKLVSSKSISSKTHKGYNISKNDGKAITIKSKFSEVVLKQ
ncbi:hypothetical protein [Flagellimonas zhangzhouensis]|uniref:Adhesin domain-containing protein n=1 Tax=Flagellimonas zhangzhouensis TaxID=1073328 RepID=A0A1H2R009_9FLAO|nr:hypothetical protein [Allomuricauda zhangzhouensis]SDQ58409.1 hypothetical protein SAMN05216294_1778 [Allomuricauda zhangzhouensis]SDW12753.1 hypothetical protein SAMN04487892_0430 [Allomuricauda zhangzhouensis]